MISTKSFFWHSAILLFVVLLFIPFDAIKADDDEEEGEVIDLLIDPNGSPVGRSLNAIPISAIYMTQYGVVATSFLCDLGDVTIRLSNLTIGTSSSQVIDSNCGSCLIPIIWGTGYYRIEFHAQDGTSYYGYFNVQ